MVLVNVQLKPNLEETNFCSQHVNVAVSQLSTDDRGWPRACGALLHGSGLRTRVSPQAGTPQGPSLRLRE